MIISVFSRSMLVLACVLSLHLGLIAGSFAIPPAARNAASPPRAPLGVRDCIAISGRARGSICRRRSGIATYRSIYARRTSESFPRSQGSTMLTRCDLDAVGSTSDDWRRAPMALMARSEFSPYQEPSHASTSTHASSTTSVNPSAANTRDSTPALAIANQAAVSLLFILLGLRSLTLLEAVDTVYSGVIRLPAVAALLFILLANGVGLVASLLGLKLKAMQKGIVVLNMAREVASLVTIALWFLYGAFTLIASHARGGAVEVGLVSALARHSNMGEVMLSVFWITLCSQIIKAHWI